MEQNTTQESPEESLEALKSQIASLQSQLTAAKTQLQIQIPPSTPSPPLHLWLLLADSALPIGSFAFSSGLESYISHRSLRPAVSPKPTPRTELTRFLRLSLLSISTTTIPFITAAFKSPSSVLTLDDTFDATTTCEVARRASISQGRALCSVWDKSFASSLLKVNSESDGDDNEGKSKIPIHYRPDHFGPSWGYITRLSGLPNTKEALEQVVFVFLFNHVKALLSAAVRLSLIGPYVAQQILASEEVGRLVREAVERGGKIGVEEAGQSVPTVDLWQGRHERLYTRIFNS
ncbi:hypothetical protein TWF569_011310 [Orbilia oligospora]|uniref:Urease accessory protein n=1 Tax=Orbilia oligospora TaxID=2813651 RepID=A0A7C8N4T6_ORBOL|nr:hypothetical protein TWF706_001516 [Orbilia oligospora]KAF3090136.1 hypothetical protein TWF103_000628 [Orbilia oligospora]KAF3091477.1 hypothetical protein TWF102_008764 [Orbilia oligospora]KAF3128460.1 hypothetical protein TWF703_009528 [Orbilia oligospora]KAF3132850.1 hypothetical protein TWF594_009367 [Orbilia oligospora]